MLAPATAITRAKSPEAFRTISEVSVELDVPQHVLRFWESRFAQVRPVKRAGGRRYYRPEDVDLLRGIRALLYADGFTIRGVQKILRERGLRHVAEIGRSSANVSNDLHAFDETDETADFDPAERDEDLACDGAPLDDEPRHARAAIAALERAHGESAERVALSEENRVKLELLLAELLQLKVRLRSARPVG